jgi:RNA polymerase sigma-70 factor, ECF subfamily
MPIDNPVESKSDEELVRLTLVDQNNFAFIIDRYKVKLYTYIRRITNVDADEVEDILQEVFIKIYLNLNEYDTGLKFSSWAYRIAHNPSISHFRKANARPHGHLAELEETEINNLTCDLDIAKETDSVLTGAKIREVLEKLDEKYREVLVLKYLEEKSYQEISDIIKRPMGTVASLINKAKSEFKKILEEENVRF